MIPLQKSGLYSKTSARICEDMIYKCAVILICATFLPRFQTNGEVKYCNYRDRLLPEIVWKDYTGYSCYNYTNEYRLKFSLYPPVPTTRDNITIPGFKDGGKIYTFDYEDEASLPHLRPVFKTEYYFRMWMDCAKEAYQCCESYMTNENILPTEEYPCPATWDGWTCFPPTTAGTVLQYTCSKQAFSTESDVCELKSKKECFTNGTWNVQTDVSGCAIAPVLRNRHKFNVISLAVSSVLCFPSLVIFFGIQNLRNNLRVVFHRNLIFVIIIRNLLTIMTKEIIILDALKNTGSNGILEGNGVACRVLAFFENAAKNGMYACMLADGFYLHKLIVRAFASDPNILHIYGAVCALTLLPSLIWATVRGAHGGLDCWMVDDSQDQWISDGFRMAILAINCILLLDIIRVMVLKVKHGTISQQVRATLRATLFLLPLFGVQIFIITNRNMVTSKTCYAEDIYYYASYTIEGLQGVMVAILFCYMNSEVQRELKNKYRKVVLHLQSRYNVGFGGNYQDDDRRATTATYVAPKSTKC